MSHFNFTYSAVSKLLGVFHLFNLTTKLDGTVNVADGKLSHGPHQVTCVLFPKWWQCPFSSLMAWGPNRAAILSQITLVSTGVASAFWSGRGIEITPLCVAKSCFTPVTWVRNNAPSDFKRHTLHLSLATGAGSALPSLLICSSGLMIDNETRF